MDMGMKYSIWTSAHNAYIKNDYETALKIYSSIDHLPQVLFNMASIAICTGKIDQAIDYLTKALTIDKVIYYTANAKKFAIAYYQRGFCYFSGQKYQPAASDFSTARKLLKTKKVVDYSPAGLEFKLYMCELLYNSAQCYVELEHTKKAQVLLSLATKFVVTHSHSNALNSSLQHIFSVEPGLQFIPALKLKTVESQQKNAGNQQPSHKGLLQKLPMTFPRRRSSSESMHVSKNYVMGLEDLRDVGKPLRTKSLILHHLSTGVFSDPDELDEVSSPKLTRNSILKIQSLEGNFMILVEPNTCLEALKQKVELKLRNIGSYHYEDLELIKNGSILKSDNDLQDFLLHDESLNLKIEKDVVDLYLDL